MAEAAGRVRATMSATLFRNVRILDCTGEPAFAGSVLVTESR